jgi:hypothetical protein
MGGLEPTPYAMSHRWQLGKLEIRPIEQQRPLGLLKQKIYSWLLFTNVIQYEQWTCPGRDNKVQMIRPYDADTV